MIPALTVGLGLALAVALLTSHPLVAASGEPILGEVLHPIARPYPPDGSSSADFSLAFDIRFTNMSQETVSFPKRGAPPDDRVWLAQNGLEYRLNLMEAGDMRSRPEC